MKGVYADVIKWHGNARVDGPGGEREGGREGGCNVFVFLFAGL